MKAKSEIAINSASAHNTAQSREPALWTLVAFVHEAFLLTLLETTGIQIALVCSITNDNGVCVICGNLWPVPYIDLHCKCILTGAIWCCGAFWHRPFGTVAHLTQTICCRLSSPDQAGRTVRSVHAHVEVRAQRQRRRRTTLRRVGIRRELPSAALRFIRLSRVDEAVCLQREGSQEIPPQLVRRDKRDKQSKEI